METFFDRFVMAGGIMMVFLIPTSIIALALIIYGLLDLRRQKVMPAEVGSAFAKMGNPPEMDTLRERIDMCPESPLRRICLRLLPWVGMRGETWDMTVQQVTSDGFIDNEFLGKDDTNDRDELTVRGKLSWLVGDASEIGLMLGYIDIDNGYDAFSLDNDRDTLSDEPGHDIQESTFGSLTWSWAASDRFSVEAVGTYADTDVEYGYQWWAATAGAHHFDVAIGHGGQYIALVHNHNMVIVVLSDPFQGQHDAESWKYELGNLNMVSDFIESLPKEDK